jgi:hypothetical protein
MGIVIESLDKIGGRDGDINGVADEHRQKAERDRCGIEQRRNQVLGDHGGRAPLRGQMEDAALQHHVGDLADMIAPQNLTAGGSKGFWPIIAVESEISDVQNRRCALDQQRPGVAYGGRRTSARRLIRGD